MSRTEHSVKNTFWGMAYRFLHMLFPVILRAVIIRFIGAEYVGLSGLFKSILSVLNLTELGFGTAIIYLMYEPVATDNKAEIRALLSLLKQIYWIIGISILILGCSVFPLLNILVKNDTGVDINIYLLYGMYLLHTAGSYFLFAYRSAIFTAYQRSDINYKIMFFCGVVEYLIKILVLLFTGNYYLYILVFVLMIIPQNLSYFLLSKKYYPDLYCEGKPSQEQIAAIKRKVGILFGHRLGATVVFSIDDVLISAFLGVSVLTTFDNYNYIMSAIVTLLGVVLTSIVASIGNKLVLDTTENIYALFKRINFLWIGLVGWCTCCLLSLYQPFITLWVGGQYCFPENTVIVIATYFFCWQFRQAGLTMKDAAGLWEPDKLKPYVGMILNLFFSIVLVNVIGSVIGVLIPTICILVFVYFPWETKVLLKYLFKGKTADYLSFLLKTSISVVFSIMITYIFIRNMPEIGFGWFVLRIIISMFFMPLLFCLLNIKTPQFKESFLMIRRFAEKRRLH